MLALAPLLRLCGGRVSLESFHIFLICDKFGTTSMELRLNCTRRREPFLNA